MPAGAPKENTNAEKWDEETALDFMQKALDLSQQKDTVLLDDGREVKADNYKYDFIGEICRELKVYKELLTYLANKFESCKNTHNQILTNLEANCFHNSKKGKIREATAIVNLKSNYGWTDRQQTDHTTGGEKINLTPISFVSTNKDK